MLGKQRPFPLLSCQQAWAGFQASQLARQVGCDWMNWSWLTASQVSALLGKGQAVPGESGPMPCLGFPLTTHPLGTFPNPSTFFLSCNLLKGGSWLPAQPRINSHPLSFTHFVSTQQAGVSLAPLGFSFPPEFTLYSLHPNKGDRCLCSHSTCIPAGLGIGGYGTLSLGGDGWTPQVGRFLV